MLTPVSTGKKILNVDPMATQVKTPKCQPMLARVTILQYLPLEVQDTSFWKIVNVSAHRGTLFSLKYIFCFQIINANIFLKS